jgi:hypothetical protein
MLLLANRERCSEWWRLAPNRGGQAGSERTSSLLVPGSAISHKPGVTETRLWGSYEKVTVIRRETAEEGKRRGDCARLQ